MTSLILTQFLTSVFYFFLLLLPSKCITHANLSPLFYARTCPQVESIVRATMAQAVLEEPRLAASILRLHYHDCFVNGCDGSVLLDDTPTFKGEKSSPPNQNSLKGFKLMDRIKFKVEVACKDQVSCSDILALAARDAVALSGGPGWTVQLGRRDTRITTHDAANTNLPSPHANLTALILLFASKGLTIRDMTALSGAHTIGMARCTTYRDHIYKGKIDPYFATIKKATCPISGGDNNLTPLDVRSATRFDNSYYKNIMAMKGLLHTDQELFNIGPQLPWVALYAKSNVAFGKDFITAMVKMGNMSPLTGIQGEIRRDCRFVN